MVLPAIRKNGGYFHINPGETMEQIKVRFEKALAEAIAERDATIQQKDALMKQLNGDKQMTDVWRLPTIARWEKSQGKHPTQKPLSLLGRRYLGIEREEEFLRLSRARREEIESLAIADDYRHRIKDIATMEGLGDGVSVSEEIPAIDLPF